MAEQHNAAVQQLTALVDLIDASGANLQYPKEQQAM
jgi:hypothetical protein